jgi:stage II sporulation protein R
MKLKKWETALVAALALTLLAGSALSTQQQKLSDKLIRLHVVANSDSPEDQAAKLAARDSVLSELDSLLSGVNDRAEASNRISQNLRIIENAARRAAGDDRPIRAELKPEFFPTRQYDTFALPAGRYMSLCVTLGEGGGRNWWCVVFPPLCAPSAADSGDALRELTDTEITLITDTSVGVTVKFKALEIIGKVRELLGV